jgi:hypothetical protein
MKICVIKLYPELIPIFGVEKPLGGLRVSMIKSKSKVVPVLPLTEHHAMKAYCGSGGTGPPIL